MISIPSTRTLSPSYIKRLNYLSSPKGRATVRRLAKEHRDKRIQANRRMALTLDPKIQLWFSHNVCRRCRLPLMGHISVPGEWSHCPDGAALTRRNLYSPVKPGDAKRLGQRVVLRPFWDANKRTVMLDLLRRKFRDATLMTNLLGTEEAKLVESNTWGDRYWGVCFGQGENHLGKLMSEAVIAAKKMVCKHYGMTANDRKWLQGSPPDSYKDASYRFTAYVLEGSPAKGYVISSGNERNGMVMALSLGFKVLALWYIPV